jgi:hypothetical protein
MIFPRTSFIFLVRQLPLAPSARVMHGCRDFLAFDLAFLVGAVAQTVFLEELARAALAPVVLLGAFVDLLACKV